MTVLIKSFRYIKRERKTFSGCLSRKGNAMKREKSLIFIILILGVVGCGQEVKIVEVEPNNISFTKKTQTTKIKVKAMDIRSVEIPGISFTFSSENPAVADVDGDGMVTPRGNGSTAIVARTSTGVTGESFVKVCLPKEIKCDPSDRLQLRVGISAPIKCQLTDCNDAVIPGRISLKAADEKMLLQEGDDVFIGLAVGDTLVKVEAYGIEKTVAVRVDEQVFLPGMGPGSGGGGGGKGGKGGGGGNKDPYSSGGGRFDHILKNMQLSGN